MSGVPGGGIGRSAGPGGARNASVTLSTSPGRPAIASSIVTKAIVESNASRRVTIESERIARAPGSRARTITPTATAARRRLASGRSMTSATISAVVAMPPKRRSPVSRLHTIDVARAISRATSRGRMISSTLTDASPQVRTTRPTGKAAG